MLDSDQSSSRPSSGMKLNLMPEPEWTDRFDLQSKGSEIVKKFRTFLGVNEETTQRKITVRVSSPVDTIPSKSGMTLNLLPQKTKSQIFFEETGLGRVLAKIGQGLAGPADRSSKTSSTRERVANGNAISKGNYSPRLGSGMKLNLLPKREESFLDKILDGIKSKTAKPADRTPAEADTPPLQQIPVKTKSEQSAIPKNSGMTLNLLPRSKTKWF